MPKITTLYRPVGQRELDLLKASNFRSWPPRLPEQPIFYPVTNEAYAIQIARDWNVKDPTNGNVGYVTAFDVDTEYLRQFPIEVVGGRLHAEHWIPAERLEEFNKNIKGVIRVIRKYTPDGEIPLTNEEAELASGGNGG